jgi:hypothetical protein
MPAAHRCGAFRCDVHFQDAYWTAHGENDKSKASKKREEEEKKRAEALAKKAEAKRLADAELEELAKTKAKAEKAGSQKVKDGRRVPRCDGAISFGYKARSEKAEIVLAEN